MKIIGQLSLLFLVTSFVVACQPAEPKQVTETEPSAKEEVADFTALARQLARETIILDGHIDVPYRLQEGYVDVSEATDGGDFDYPRAVDGGLNAPFMSIYIPAKLQITGGSKELADELIDSVEKIVNDSPDKFALAFSTADVEDQFGKGLISLPMGMENGSPIEGSLDNLKHFYERGIRYITLAHSKANHISDSSYDKERPAGGLTEFGEKLIVEMNNIGIMVDVSHISDEAFYQVMDITQVPVIASHSSARHFTPGFERNMSDDMIKALGANGGVIQINYGSSFVTRTANEYQTAFGDARQAFMDANGIDDRDNEAVKQFAKDYRQKQPYPYATLDDVLDHFDHVVKLVGIDHVGIGSDYDGVGDSLPIGLKDVSTYPALIEGLLKRGYSPEDVRKILSANVMRVWKTVEQYANSKKAP